MFPKHFFCPRSMQQRTELKRRSVSATTCPHLEGASHVCMYFFQLIMAILYLYDTMSSSSRVEITPCQEPRIWRAARTRESDRHGSTAVHQRGARRAGWRLLPLQRCMTTCYGGAHTHQRLIFPLRLSQLHDLVVHRADSRLSLVLGNPHYSACPMGRFHFSIATHIGRKRPVRLKANFD